MKIKTSLKLALAGALLAGGATTAMFAQSATPLSPADNGGLLGQEYTGVEFGYTHHVESAPAVLHRYGFVSSRPLVEAKENVDAAFRYNYTRGSAFGSLVTQHDVAVAFTGYLPLGTAKPFVEGDAGWAWQRGDVAHQSGFMYLIGAGVELAVAPRVAVAPFVNYTEAPRFHDHIWNFGARTSYRFDRTWSGTFTVDVDDQHNVEYAVGVQRRF
ncbi:MAG TPA: hypothetical protein VHD62_05485 [Opitutaceae bacterium]|nr:hypothetical protein [Opitutaceae bacterium]